MTQLQELRIIIRGAGDLATGLALKLHRCGFTHLLMLESQAPMAVRRKVAFSEAVNWGEVVVEGVTARCITGPKNIAECWQNRVIPVCVDPDGASLSQVQADVVVDAILAKRNLGTNLDSAELVIGLGPGFTAAEDVHCVIETMRGHDLGRVLWQGSAAADTGIPGSINGYSYERLLRAPAAGIFETECDIGDMVTQGDCVGTVAGHPVQASLSGMLRGLLRSGISVAHNAKLGDIDPRGTEAICDRVSDKAMAVAGGVLEAILHHYNR
jgi:xanthine dehydrogenase accessory factor